MRTRRRSEGLASFISLLLCATLATAFDCTGHIFVALVALQQVPPSVAAELQPLFQELAMRYTDVSTVAEAACFPDDMKSWTSQYSNWHYYDGCYSVGGAACPATPEGLLPVALAAAEAGLGNRSLSNAERGFWLAFVLHLVGDAHQPLHVCEQYSPHFPGGDAGGNYFLVNFNGTWTGLHELLDNGTDDLLLPQNLQRPIMEYPALLQQFAVATNQLVESSLAIPEAVATDLRFATWQSEGMAICTSAVYGNLTNGSSVNATYVNNLNALMKLRVALAGRRLSVILTNALGEPPATPQPPPLSQETAAILATASGFAVAVAAVFAIAKNTWCRRVRDRALMDEMAYESSRFR